jgi:hypothetical protein
MSYRVVATLKESVQTKFDTLKVLIVEGEFDSTWQAQQWIDTRGSEFDPRYLLGVMETSNAVGHSTRNNIKCIIESRLKQHRDNLAGWSEGERCPCDIGKGHKDTLVARTFICPMCRSTGIKLGTKGYLLPTEPDPEEREAVRERLRTAISELEIVLKEIG